MGRGGRARAQIDGLTKPIRQKECAPDGARHFAGFHDCGRAGVRLDRRLHRRATAPAAAGGLSAGGRRGGAVYAGICCGYAPRPTARGDRRDAADVRRGDALLAGRSACSEGGRVARRDFANGAHDRLWHRRGVALGLAAWGGFRIRAGAVGGEHGGAAARARGAECAPHARGAHRRGLAHRGGPGDGAGAGAAAAAGGAAGRACVARE